MIPLALMCSVVIINCAYGRPPLPPLPIKGSCYQVSPEVEIFRVEGEAVILAFPVFKRVLEVRNIAPPTTNYLITKGNGTEAIDFEEEGRVQQQNKQLWFLPVQASDSGEYVCSYRNETYCITGSITLHVYQSSSVDMEKLSYPISAAVGEDLTFRCPSLSNFNKTDRPIEWFKDSRHTGLDLSGRGSFRQDRGNLKIPVVKPSHAGVYTCQLNVLINNQQYKVSRLILLHVQGPDPGATTTVPDHYMTSDPGLISSSSYTTDDSPIIQPPVIVSPLNGTIVKSPHGSALELFCTVLTDCERADSTVVKWLYSSQSVETSYLDEWILQRGRRVTRVSEGCQIEQGLAVVMMTEEVKTELKCVTQNQGGRQEVVIQLQLEDSTFTWLVVAVVAMSCFLSVVSAFLCVIFKPKRKKKADYILARQNSIF